MTLITGVRQTLFLQSTHYIEPTTDGLNNNAAEQSADQINIPTVAACNRAHAAAYNTVHSKPKVTVKEITTQ